MIVSNRGLLVGDRDSNEFEKPLGGLGSYLGHDRGNLK